MASLGSLLFTAPEVSAPTVAPLHLALSDHNGAARAANHLPLSLFPAWGGPATPTARLWSGIPLMAGRLAALGYNVVAGQRDADVLIIDRLDAAARELLRQGATLLLIANHLDAIRPDFLGMSLQPRTGTVWRGDWASSFSWLRRTGPFARLPGGPLLDSGFERVAPELVLAGLGPWEFAEHVHAGLFVGWIHKLVALIAERRYGTGRLIATTFRLTPGLLGADPVATTLFDALVELAAGGSGPYLTEQAIQEEGRPDG